MKKVETFYNKWVMQEMSSQQLQDNTKIQYTKLDMLLFAKSYNQDTIVEYKIILPEILAYMEAKEVVIDEEFGSCRGLKELINKGDMPKLYDKLLSLRNNNK